MVIFEWALIAGICWLISSTIVNAAKQNQQKYRLEQAFYQLIEAENGCISLMQLAVAAKADADTSKRFLDTQVKAFQAELAVDADGDAFYRFPKVRRSPER